MGELKFRSQELPAHTNLLTYMIVYFDVYKICGDIFLLGTKIENEELLLYFSLQIYKKLCLLRKV